MGLLEVYLNCRSGASTGLQNTGVPMPTNTGGLAAAINRVLQRRGFTAATTECAEPLRDDARAVPQLRLAKAVARQCIRMFGADSVRCAPAIAHVYAAADGTTRSSRGSASPPPRPARVLARL